MAELLIRIVDKVGSTPELDRHCSKAGDLIAVCPDGWKWGRKELENPEWAVVKLPGVPEEQFAAMQRSLHDADGNLLLKRERHFDPQVLNRLVRGGRHISLGSGNERLLLEARKVKQPPTKIILR